MRRDGYWVRKLQGGDLGPGGSVVDRGSGPHIPHNSPSPFRRYVTARGERVLAPRPSALLRLSPGDRLVVLAKDVNRIARSSVRRGAEEALYQATSPF